MSPDEYPIILPDYPVVVDVPVQWGDMDAFAHVNNTVFLRWLEVGRIAFFARAGLVHDPKGTGTILATVTCHFRRPVAFPDRISVGTKLAKIGTTSVGLDHAIVSGSTGEVVAEGSSTVVHFDYAAGKPSPVPVALRREIEAFQTGS